MLQTLRIRNLAIIEDLEVEFGPGLNVLTGETGAGKSIVIDALGLIAGSRAERVLVREGQARLSVEALFELPVDGPAAEWLTRRGLVAPGAREVLVRREVSPDGPGRAWLEGTPCTQAMLRELGSALLELHGQHEHRRLLDEPRQAALLDRFGGHAEPLNAVRRAAEALHQAQARLAELQALGGGQLELRVEELRRVLREIEGLAPRPGELEQIERERRLLQSAARVGELLDQALGLCSAGEPSARSLAAAAAARAAELAALDPTLEDAASRLAAATVELQDLARGFESYAERRTFDPGRLEDLEVRRSELRRLCLRHGTDEAGLAATAERAAAELRELELLEPSRQDAERQRQQAAESYARAARRLSQLRRAAAPRLAAAVQGQLTALALKHARFEVLLEPLEGGPTDGRGAERVTFLLAANPGEPARPLAAVASGGELSRIMLALHVGGGSEEERVQVFDEADAGVGGAVADAVGARLARLARRQQVLCVTHLPQIAAWADRHLRVSKSVAGGRTRTSVEALEGSLRVDELARMLDGRRRTPTSRRHASELLEAAGRNQQLPAR